ncbi:MAG: hypothetical protein DRP02_08470 [Candidatus Gerdarchaeota archaeon]|nr:MAG: hypothetical protein DRP02_08470 [Candidatus Gerdarchaeota archaeon]
MTGPVKDENSSSSHKKSEKGSNRDTISNEEQLAFEKEQLSKRLIEIERRALGLFELTNDAIFFLDLEGNLLDVNQRAAEILGYNRHDIIGTSIFNYIADEDQKDAKNRLKALISGEILPIYCRWFKRKDGSKFPAEINVALVQDEEGKPTYIQSAVRDISERHAVEETLKREREAFNLLAKASILSTDLVDLCKRIAFSICRVLDFDAAAIRVFEKSTSLLKVIATHGIREKTAYLEPTKLSDPNYIYTLSARLKREIIMSRFEEQSLIAQYKEKLRSVGIHELITWPILDNKNDLLGVIQLASYHPKVVSEHDFQFFETLARMFTLAFERKLGEEALKESEERYRSFAQNFQGIAFRVKKDWTPVFFHGAVEALTGYREADFLKREPEWNEIIYPADRDIVLKERKALQTTPNKSSTLEYRIIRKNGQIKWVQEISQNICDESNKILHIQGAIYDITERKRNESILEIQKDLGIKLSTITNLQTALECVLETAMDIDVFDCGCVYLVDKETGFIYPTAKKALSDEFIDEITYYSSNSPFTHAVLTGKAFYQEYDDLQVNFEEESFKEEKIRSLTIQPIYSDEDHIISILVLCSHKIDHIPLSTRHAIELLVAQIEGAIQRIDVEEALRESNEKYRTFVQNFQGIAYRMDIDYKPIFIDGACEAILGLSVEEMLSGKYKREDYIHPYDIDKLNKKMQESLQNPQKNWQMEYRIITKDGKIKWILDSWQVLVDNENNPIGYQGSIQDISEKKVAQDELQKLYEDLERRVNERTDQISEINKELVAFSYSVSHDLRTPLRHIGGFAQLLQKRVASMENKDERIEGYCQKILNSVEEMNALIDGLLTYSRMSRVEMVRIKVNLTELVHDVLNDFQIELKNRKVDIRVDILPEVVGDPSLLRLVLVNLIANALKFTKTKELAVIEIGQKPFQDPEKVTIYIRDNGVGFDMKYYERLFGVFQRLHKQEEFEGTGIGLATVQRVIRRMGGNIWAEGEVGQGATFYFTLPKADKNLKKND